MSYFKPFICNTPCVSHVQKVLEITQVKVSKHLNYMKDRGMVEATRCENRTFYSLSTETCSELETNLKCLQDCSKEYPIFKEDLIRLQAIHLEVGKVRERLCQKKNLTKR